MKYNELHKRLRKAGCYLTDSEGRHRKWYSPITDKSFVTSHHGKEEIPTGTLRSILKDAGVKL